MEDHAALCGLDVHISPAVLEQCIRQGRVLIARQQDAVAGWLRYGYFWDSLPFCNMLFVQAAHRGAGIGKALVLDWEARMCRQGHPWVLTSTQAAEGAQHFYRKLGYRDAGGFFPPGEGYELILQKNLQDWRVPHGPFSPKG